MNYDRYIEEGILETNSDYTAIPYRVSKGPEQGFPCVVFHTGKNLFSLAGIPVLKTGFSLLGKSTQGNPCSDPLLTL